MHSLIDCPVVFSHETIGAVPEKIIGAMCDGDVALLENLRYSPEEEANSPQFAQSLAKLGDLYVNDAFGAAHRAHASTAGITKFMPQSAMGFLMEKELKYLHEELDRPAKPFVVIMGGAKVSDKIGVLKALMETLTAEKQEKLPKLLDEMAQVILFLNRMKESNQVAKRQWLQKLWLQAFRVSVSGNEKINSSKLIVHLLKENVQSSELVKDLAGKFLSADRLTASILKQVKNGEVKLEKMTQSKEASLITETSFQNKSHLEEGIYVLHAGVVLLHPFLHIFFKGLGLVKENVFVNESAHQKALFLLHYMATGLRVANEHELVIEKILCAWPLEKPVGLSVPIKAEDLKEADNLLTEVIRQWKILKKTSFAGLREGFLQRSGKLYARNDNLRLQVETSAVDVLLDELPWNLALIKLPWMNDILRVEWR